MPTKNDYLTPQTEDLLVFEIVARSAGRVAHLISPQALVGANFSVQG